MGPFKFLDLTKRETRIWIIGLKTVNITSNVNNENDERDAFGHKTKQKSMSQEKFFFVKKC